MYFRDVAFTDNWYSIEHEIKQFHSSAVRMDEHGAYRSAYSNDGQLLAVAMNQLDPNHNCLLFISPRKNIIVTSHLKGCGAKSLNQSNFM